MELDEIDVIEDHQSVKRIEEVRGKRWRLLAKRVCAVGRDS